MDKFKMLQNVKQPIKLNLQFFADGEGGEGGEGATQEPPASKTEGEESGKESKMFSQDDLNKIISDRLSKERSKWEREFDEKLEREKKEAERLAKLSEKERKEEELTKKEQELADRLAELERKELKADAVADLTDKGLPATFADFLLAENAEKTLENINSFKKAFDDAVNEAVKGKLRQDTPPASGGTLKNNSVKLSDLAQQNRIIK